jgi:hypothetical protein
MQTHDGYLTDITLLFGPNYCLSQFKRLQGVPYKQKGVIILLEMHWGDGIIPPATWQDYPADKGDYPAAALGIIRLSWG